MGRTWGVLLLTVTAWGCGSDSSGKDDELPPIATFDLWLDELAFIKADEAGTLTHDGATYSIIKIDDFETGDDVTGDDVPRTVAGEYELPEEGERYPYFEYGFWENDKGGLTIDPDRDADIVATEGGANDTTRALHYTGRDAGCQWGTVIAASLLRFDKDFVSDAGRGPNTEEKLDNLRTWYDAETPGYAGVTFWAKGKNGANSFRVKVPEPNTTPTEAATDAACSFENEEGPANHCYDDFGKDLALTEEWTQHVVLFEEMEQGYGGTFDLNTSRIYSIDFLLTCTAISG